MESRLPWSLAVLAAVVTGGVLAAAPAPAGKAKSATVELHRCTDARGKITWQDDKCPAGSKDEVRQMARPTDPPPRAAVAHAPTPAPVPQAPPPEPLPPQRQLIPPPDMYLCTSYDGIERYSEQYDPNPRCEPIVLYYPHPETLSPALQNSCRWVEDSCVRLSDRAACAQFRAKKVEAASLRQRAFSDTIEYRKSELARLTQIVDESCP
jgi:hypothetical protein